MAIINSLRASGRYGGACTLLRDRPALTHTTLQVERAPGLIKLAR